MFNNAIMLLMVVLSLLSNMAVGVDHLRPPTRHFLQLGRDSTTSSSVSTSNSAAVTGMCSASQDSVGSLSSAASSGIQTIAQCGQFAKDHSTSSAAGYVSFSSENNQCLWFTSCACLTSGSACLGGSAWTSIAVADLFSTTSDSVVATTSAPSSQSAMVSPATAKAATTATTSSSSTDEVCDTSSSDLMQYFQTKCAMNQSMWTSRLFAGAVMLVAILVTSAMFGIAYHFNKKEQMGLEGNNVVIIPA